MSILLFEFIKALSGLIETVVLSPLFLTETGFKTAILLTHEKRYVDEIRERIIKSIEVLKEEEK